MTLEEKNKRIIELSNNILELKKLGPSVLTKKTIQKLQQKMDKLTQHEL